ncbi:MAG: O-antigen ligase domain-containing protein, partial [Tannerellaceae bacterium]
MSIHTNTKQFKLYSILFLVGLMGIAASLMTSNFLLALAIVCLPFLFITGYLVLCYPLILFVLTFTINYYLMGLTRYANLSGISFLMDSLMAATLVIILIHTALFKNIEWKFGLNALTIGSFVWMIYCLAEIGNPTGMLEAWILSRGLIFNGFLISLIVSLVCVRYQTVKQIVFLLSIFTMTAVLKAIMQKYWGFDSGEQQWL